MDRARILQAVSDVLQIDVHKLESLGDNTSLRFYSLSSLKAIQLIVQLEQSFSIEIDDSDLTIDNVETVANIMELVRRYI